MRNWASGGLGIGEYESEDHNLILWHATSAEWLRGLNNTFCIQDCLSQYALLRQLDWLGIHELGMTFFKRTVRMGRQNPLKEIILFEKKYIM